MADIDLFSLQGIVVEREIPNIDLFSLQGILIEYSEPIEQVARARVLVAQRIANINQVGRVRVLVAQKAGGVVDLPTNTTPLQMLQSLVNKLLNRTLDYTKFTFGTPVSAGTSDPKATKVLINALEGSGYRSSDTLTYLRRSIQELGGLNLKPGAGFTSMTDVIKAYTDKGYLISAADFDLTRCKVNSTQIALYPNANSYLFMPTGSLVFGAQLSFAQSTAQTKMNGFEVGALGA